MHACLPTFIPTCIQYKIIPNELLVLEGDANKQKLDWLNFNMTSVRQHLNCPSSHYWTLRNFLFNLKRSWFSKWRELSLTLLGLKTRPAMLNSLSHAAEAGKGVFSFRDSLHKDGKDFSDSILSDEKAKYPSSSLELSVWGDCSEEKKSSSSEELGLPPSDCRGGASRCSLM